MLVVCSVRDHNHTAPVSSLHPLIVSLCSLCSACRRQHRHNPSPANFQIRVDYPPWTDHRRHIPLRSCLPSRSAPSFLCWYNSPELAVLGILCTQTKVIEVIEAGEKMTVHVRVVFQFFVLHLCCSVVSLGVDFALVLLVCGVLFCSCIIDSLESFAIAVCTRLGPTLVAESIRAALGLYH